MQYLFTMNRILLVDHSHCYHNLKKISSHNKWQNQYWILKACNNKYSKSLGRASIKMRYMMIPIAFLLTFFSIGFLQYVLAYRKHVLIIFFSFQHMQNHCMICSIFQKIMNIYINHNYQFIIWEMTSIVCPMMS